MGGERKSLMTQLAQILPVRECRQCRKKKLTAFLEIEGAIVVVEKSSPNPYGASIFIHRGIFCGMTCFQKYVLMLYNSGKKGRVNP